jgi:hypothetical protein
MSQDAANLMDYPLDAGLRIESTVRSEVEDSYIQTFPVFSRRGGWGLEEYCWRIRLERLESPDWPSQRAWSRPASGQTTHGANSPTFSAMEQKPGSRTVTLRGQL